MKRKNYINIGVIFIAAVLCGIYFYSQLIHIQIPIHSDDAGLAVDINNTVHNGSAVIFRNYFNPFYYMNLLAYKLFGGTEFMLQIIFTFKYFGCIFLAMLLACYNLAKKEIHLAILPVFVFISSMPGNSGTATIHSLKFHVDSTFYLLLFLCILQFINVSKKIKYSILGFIAILAILTGDILVVVVLWLPVILYFIYLKWKSGLIVKNTKYIIIITAVLLVVVRVLFENVGFNGYGSRTFSSMGDITYNIGLGIQGLMQMFNVLIVGEKILQFNMAIYIIRLVFILLCVGNFVRICIKLARKKDVDQVDTILTFGVICIFSAYIFSGRQEDLISVRYMSCLNYILPILFCRQFSMQNLYENRFYIKKMNIITCSAILLIIAFVQPISFTRDNVELDNVANLIMQDSKLYNGIGGYWVGNVINVLTKNHNEVQAVQIQNGKVNSYLNEWQDFKMGSNYFNFLIEDKYTKGEPDNRGGITKDNVISMYGKPKETLQVEGRTIYGYDFDIRTAPLIFDYDNPYHIAIGETSKYGDKSLDIQSQGNSILENLYLPIGVQRLTIKGKNMNKDLQLRSKNQNIKIKLEKVTSTKAVYQIETNSLTKNVELELVNRGSDVVNLNNFTLVHEKDSVELNKNKKKFLFDASRGEYNITFSGTDIKNLNIDVEQNGKKLDVKRINNGDEYVAFEYEATENGSVSVTPSKEVKHAYIETPYEKRTSSELVYTVEHGIHINQKVKIEDEAYVLQKDQVTFGPYATLTKGKYLVHVSGRGLDSADVHITADSGEKTFDVKNIVNSSSYQEMELDLNKDYTNIEIVVKNPIDQEINVKYYAISKE